jgi:hypothetical protein
MPKLPHYYECILCPYKCKKLSEIDKHILTTKHKKLATLNPHIYVSNAKNFNLNSQNASPPITIIKEIRKYNCKTCGKVYNANNSLWYHFKKCKNKPLIETKLIPSELITNEPNNNTINDTTNNTVNNVALLSVFKQHSKLLETNNKLLETIYTNKSESNNSYPLNNRLIDIIVDKTKCIEDLKNKLEPAKTDEQLLENTEIKWRDQKIQLLEDCYLKKQKRKHYNEENVIYMVTTEDNKNKRIYIIGKAFNLTNRLSTYNKTAEHEVVYYRSAKNKEMLSVVESSILLKLDSYKEKANRDRFVLPVENDISLFTNIINSCIDFFSD